MRREVFGSAAWLSCRGGGSGRGFLDGEERREGLDSALETKGRWRWRVCEEGFEDEVREVHEKIGGG